MVTTPASASPEKTDEAAGEHGRRAQRKSLFVQGRLRVGSKSYPCRIKDLSTNGARLEFEQAMSSHAAGSLYIPRIGDVQGKLIWTNSKLAGFQYEDSVPMQLLHDMYFHEPPAAKIVVAARKAVERIHEQAAEAKVRTLRTSFKAGKR